MPQKSPLKWWAWDLRGVLRVLNKNSAGVELPLWRLFCSFTRQTVDWTWPRKIKVLHMWWVALLAL